MYVIAYIQLKSLILNNLVFIQDIQLLTVIFATLESARMVYTSKSFLPTLYLLVQACTITLRLLFNIVTYSILRYTDYHKQM